MTNRRGVLAGLQVDELGAIGRTLLRNDARDHGINIVRKSISVPSVGPISDRMVDLLPESAGHRDRQNRRGRNSVLGMIDQADVVMKPSGWRNAWVWGRKSACGNPRLVYGRITGWGRRVPGNRAGHDLFLAASGTLSFWGAWGAAHSRGPSVTWVGAMMLAFGVMAALWERSHSEMGRLLRQHPGRFGAPCNRFTASTRRPRTADAG